MQTFIAIVIVALSVLYFIRRIIKDFRREDCDGKRCGKCRKNVDCGKPNTRKQ